MIRYSLSSLGFLAVVALAFSCGRPNRLELGEFKPYVDRFEQKASENGQTVKVTDLVVKFGRMENKLERGICEINGDNTPTITINEESWGQMDENEREPLLFHELGHCVLHRRHKPATLSPGVPASLMNPYTIADYTYAEHRDYYIHELFSARNDF